MKKTVSIIIFIASSLIVFLSVIYCFYGIYDIKRIFVELENNPSASGIDYWGIGWGYGFNLFAYSALGLILSSINIKLLQKKALRNISIAETVLSVLLVIASICMFCI